MEAAGGECADAERQEHVAQLRHRRIGKHAFDIVLNQANRCREDGRQRAHDRDHFHRLRSQHEQRVRARHHVNTGGDHGGRMDERRYRRRAFHGIRQPDIQRKLRRFAAGSEEQQQAGRLNQHAQVRVGDNLPGVRAGQRRDVGKLCRSKYPHQGERPEDHARVANPVGDESLVRRRRCRVLQEVEADQQVRAQAHALPADEHEYVVIPQDERQHGEHKQVQVAKEPVVPALVRHVSNRVNVDQHADAGYEQQPDAR